MILIVWMCGTTLQIGLMGSDFPDAAREWLARLGASVSIAMAAWLGLIVLAVFGPYWLAWVTLRWAPAGAALAGGWLLSGIGGYLSGKSEKTKGGPSEEGADSKTRALELLAKVAPVLFLAGFLLFVSLGTHLLLRAVSNPVDCMVPVTRNIPHWLLWLEPVRREYWCFLYYTNETLLAAGIALLAACGLIIAILPLRLNINEFSMHHFYKNRLVRCYLGASHENRKPNRLTGFDPHDDFPIATLLPSDPLLSYRGPYPIVNCALNLNTGSELAKQERRGASFVFTPRYCGFDPPHSKEDRAVTHRTGDLNAEGYRATPGYMEPPGPGLGTAIAISGAAANPNAGYHTSAPLAFLMTILNVRLGWWLGNPRRDAPSARPGPKNALVSLLSELFAQSNGRSRYVNVSDGGHFENLGLYELVRRRCRYIVVSDSEADPGARLRRPGRRHSQMPRRFRSGNHHQPRAHPSLRRPQPLALRGGHHHLPGNGSRIRRRRLRPHRHNRAAARHRMAALSEGQLYGRRARGRPAIPRRLRRLPARKHGRPVFQRIAVRKLPATGPARGAHDI